ncbi:hypothetical protein GCM10009722_32700 [Williamsia deligens]
MAQEQRDDGRDAEKRCDEQSSTLGERWMRSHEVTLGTVDTTAHHPRGPSADPRADDIGPR